MAADRKETPDILGSLLGGSEAPKKKDTSKEEYLNTGIPEYLNNSIPVKKNTSITEVRHTTKPASRKKPAVSKDKKAAPEEKVKASFYLDAGAVEALEDGWMELRKLAPKKARTQISKSLIVELALQIALDELKAKGARSSLASKAIKE